MNKEHFLTELKIHLKPLSHKQLAYILQLYTEKFDKKIAQGQSEALVSKDLGNPRDIAANILEEFDLKTSTTTHPYDEWQEFTTSGRDKPYKYSHYLDDEYYPTTSQNPSFFIRFCQVSGVLMLNFFLMLWLILAGILLLGSFWLVTVILVLLPVMGGLAFFMTTGAVAAFQLFISLLFCGFGFISLAVMVPLTTYSWRFLKYYVKWTMNTLRGRH